MKGTIYLLNVYYRCLERAKGPTKSRGFRDTGGWDEAVFLWLAQKSTRRVHVSSKQIQPVADAQASRFNSSRGNTTVSTAER